MGLRLRTSGRVAAMVVAAAVLVLLLTAAAPSAFAATVTCTLSRATVVFGGEITVSGVVDPAVEGDVVTLALDGIDLGTVATDSAGAYSAAFTPVAGGQVTARLADGTVSEPATLLVRPAVSLTRGAAVPFLRTRFVVSVRPETYTGQVVARVFHRGKRVATVKGTCRDGRLVIGVPLPGIEGFTVRFALASSPGLAPREVAKRVYVDWRRLAVGSRGARVRGMLTRLAWLRIRTPGAGDTFSRAVGDAVVAFQKAYRLPRDYVVDYADWRRLETASRRRPRYASPATHIEIDKTRQTLSVVRDGVVIGTIPVSTGATGNTPVGAFSVLNKNPMSSTYDGSVALPRFMRFYGTMGMHGYPVVPAYPASHGCVREPLWVCDWVYDRSFVGERVYIFN